MVREIKTKTRWILGRRSLENLPHVEGQRKSEDCVKRILSGFQKSRPSFLCSGCNSVAGIYVGGIEPSSFISQFKIILRKLQTWWYQNSCLENCTVLAIISSVTNAAMRNVWCSLTLNGLPVPMTKGLIKYWEFFFFRMLQLPGVWLLSKPWLNVVLVDGGFNSSNPVHTAREVTRL